MNYSLIRHFRQQLVHHLQWGVWELCVPLHLREQAERQVHLHRRRLSVVRYSGGQQREDDDLGVLSGTININ